MAALETAGSSGIASDHSLFGVKITYANNFNIRIQQSLLLSLTITSKSTSKPVLDPTHVMNHFHSGVGITLCIAFIASILFVGHSNIVTQIGWLQIVTFADFCLLIEFPISFYNCIQPYSGFSGLPNSKRDKSRLDLPEIVLRKPVARLFPSKVVNE